MKVGDIVTQSDEFYKKWTCDRVHLKIVNITGPQQQYIYLEKNIISREKRFDYPSSSYIFHKDYLKLDVAYVRKQKLLNLND